MTAIGEDLGMKGTPAEILTKLVLPVRHGGKLAGLVLPWRPVPILPPSEVAFSAEHISVLAALRDREPRTIVDLADALGGMAPPKVATRLATIGRELGITGAPIEILTKLVPLVREGGDLAGLVPP